VYGEVRTKYSQVYWTRNLPIELPPALVSRFAGKVMVITGYEIDQVTHSAPENSSTKGDNLGGFACFPDCSSTDKSVPSYNAYNHHYFGWLVSPGAEVYQLEALRTNPNPTRTGIRDRPSAKAHGFPTNIVFKENPGGEYRKSYHGYPSGYGQFIHSPNQWLVEPMQIDTHNRAYSLTDPVGPHMSFLPKLDTDNNMTDLHSGLSPLIECPCSDRITKSTASSGAIIVTGNCQETIQSFSACASIAASLAQLTANVSVQDKSLPLGCILRPDATTPGSYQAIFNTATNKTAPATCAVGAVNPGHLAGYSYLGNLVQLSISHDGVTANITIAGPDGSWFAVGFDAQEMSDEPYAIVIDGAGAVTERQLADHGPGSLLAPTVSVLASSVVAGVRSVTLKRAVTSSHYSIPTQGGAINMITAIGNTPALAYHKAKNVASIVLLPPAGSMCLCLPTVSHYLNYRHDDGSVTTAGYQRSCADEPRGDMLRHGDGTGANVSNAACGGGENYHGGTACCAHQNFLTDLEQADQIPAQIDVYFLKWRYYFQEYIPKTSKAPASHKHLHHWVFLIDADVNDYEEDNYPDKYGTPSIGRISAHITTAEMGLEDTIPGFKRIVPLMMSPHCHAPSCIREELWNADTNEIICNVTAAYGDLAYGPLTGVFNEANYMAIPPCLFGYQDGLLQPLSIKPGTKLTAYKYFNNTYRHLGQMAQWTGLVVYDNDPY